MHGDERLLESAPMQPPGQRTTGFRSRASEAGPDSDPQDSQFGPPLAAEAKRRPGRPYGSGPAPSPASRDGRSTRPRRPFRGGGPLPVARGERTSP